MAQLIFYEKPGCGGNARQKSLLRSAGHTLEVRDLLTHPWDRRQLLAFLEGLPVAEWFNRAAPRVKSGAVVPEQLTSEEAIDLLLREPLLIRRPLMVDEHGGRIVGFDTDRVHAWVGLAENTAPGRSLEGCAAAESGTARCEPKESEHAG